MPNDEGPCKVIVVRSPLLDNLAEVLAASINRTIQDGYRLVQLAQVYAGQPNIVGSARVVTTLVFERGDENWTSLFSAYEAKAKADDSALLFGQDVNYDAVPEKDPLLEGLSR